MKSNSTQNNLTEKKFVSPSELAEYFNVSLKTIYRLIEKREIPFYKIRRSIRFKKEDVQNYAQKNLVDSIYN